MNLFLVRIRYCCPCFSRFNYSWIDFLNIELWFHSKSSTPSWLRKLRWKKKNPCPIHLNWVDSSEALYDSTRFARNRSALPEFKIREIMIHEPSSFLKCSNELQTICLTYFTIRLDSLWMGVTAEYPAISSYTPEKAGYMNTQLSPAYALRTRNTYMSYLSWSWLRGYAATHLSRSPLLLGIC